MDPVSGFEREVKENIIGLSKDEAFKAQSLAWNIASADHHYTYNFRALGRPIIQFPQDVMALHEIIWQVKPDLIIETGIAHGGSLVSNASILALLEYSDAQKKGAMLDPSHPMRKVLGIDIDIRQHNRQAIESHFLFPHIELIEGSSIDEKTIEQVVNYAQDYNNILLCLDSNHTHEHVLAELKAFAPLVSIGSYCVVSDTIIEDVPDALSSERPWGIGNNPKTAVWEYLRLLDESKQLDKGGNPLNFVLDKALEDKLAISVSPDGYLKRI